MVPSHVDIIYYHQHCPDGWTAAWVAKQRYPLAILRPLSHGMNADQVAAVLAEAKGKDVLMIDFSLRTRAENDKLSVLAESLLILDHHKTAQAVLEGASYAVFDMSRSGAGLAWDYLHGKDSDKAFVATETATYTTGLFYTPRPWVVKYVEIRDLWQWEREKDSREVCAFLNTIPYTMSAYNDLLYMPKARAVELGAPIIAVQKQYVSATIEHALDGKLFGRTAKVLNVPYFWCSEIGNELAKDAEVSLTWFERADNIIQFSLRSIGDIDVSEIAKAYNGGGHKNAAGFQLPYREGRTLIDNITGRS